MATSLRGQVVRFGDINMENRLCKILDFTKNNIPFYHSRAPDNHFNLSEWPLLTKADLEAFFHELGVECAATEKVFSGYIVASGGSTAKPVYIRYSHDEVTSVTQNLGFHFMANGVAAGDSIVNYFGAGDMCGAFSMVDKALVNLPVTILPLSFTPRMEFALEVIERFRPNVIVGIPSLLVNLARYGQEKGLQAHFQKVYYGGEMMTTSSAELLKSMWRCELIRSAGYASTEVGTIGWQCLHCEAGEHFPFSDNIVEIVDGEVVVTSLTRTVMPVVRYRTGDRGEWVEPRCECGGAVPLFKLLGRYDTAMIIWGCWLRYEDIVNAFEALRLDFVAIQVEISSQGSDQLLTVKFESGGDPLDASETERIHTQIYEHSPDLNETLGRDVLDRFLRIQAVPVGSLRRNERTGKVIPIIDLRS